MRNLRIVPIVSLIAILLFLVPLNVYLENITLAKIFGVLSLLAVIFALRFWFANLRKGSKKSTVIRLNTNDLFLLQKNYLFISRWKDFDKNILFSRIGSVMAEVELCSEEGLLERNEAVDFSFIIGVFYFDCDFLPVSGRKITISKDLSNKFKKELLKSEKDLNSMDSTFKILKSSQLVNEFFEQFSLKN